MKNILPPLIQEVYTTCGFIISDFVQETEGKEYAACNFTLNGKKIISRNAKTTPKKTGQFVTFWKRNTNGITQPFHEKDTLDFYVINVEKGKLSGQFVIPKSVLIDKGILSTATKDGKRGFRVYPSWDETNNKQAQKTQQWQLNYFYEINEKTHLDSFQKLYNS